MQSQQSHARVVPIHKKESKNNFTNYRPISVLSRFSKILERLVFNRCISFLNKHNILFENQFGFRPKHSTNMAVIKLIDKIVNAANNNEITAGIFLDLSPRRLIPLSMIFSWIKWLITDFVVMSWIALKVT